VSETFTNRCARPDASDAADALITFAFGEILFCLFVGFNLGAVELSFSLGCTAKPFLYLIFLFDDFS
jgi:hypothetical protein